MELSLPMAASLSLGGGVLATPAFLHGVHQEDHSDVIVQGRVEQNQLLSRAGEVVEQLVKSASAEKFCTISPCPEENLSEVRRVKASMGLSSILLRWMCWAMPSRKVAFEKSLNVRRR